ncbi:RagB/SusD family nutrient uptake outer membrane protein [Echinicola shivajiensis]|uniref:RagB/SusD family nutrient uptake outer membrane protein n=1 Tax=Echinicola shivajiensis TaxID=1035916 RepID=UPI001BFC8315|nr:RagB/SusD family nutrient uptake outer membrane protein [Echinicola shivajiensis]
MKLNIKSLTLWSLVILAFGCADLDLNPLSEGSSENWFSNDEEVNMALNDLYRSYLWHQDDDSWTDDWTSREALTTITNGTINSEWSTSKSLWANSYKGITRANTILSNMDKAAEVIPEVKVKQYTAEARFVRAVMYSLLVSHYGDVILYTEVPGLEEAFQTVRTDKTTVLNQIYQDFDYAIDNLPVEYGSGDLKRATVGAAMAFKARIALYMKDWEVARDAAKACMDLGIYSLHADYGDYFRPEVKNSVETIFAIPRNVELGSQLGTNYPVKATITRNSGGWSAYNPSWDLLFSYLCSDGQPIDESPLFDPRNPFDNRDPRLNETIVPFETQHLGYMYQPHPDSVEVYDFKNARYIKNNDSRTNTQFASYNGLVWKKGVTEDWADDLNTDPDIILMRYAEILLTYAEASIELNLIDQSVLDALNMVRGRAYGQDYSNTMAYPAITISDQESLRQTVHIERRMEFAWEGLRYMDIIRWGIADKVLNNDIYGMLDPTELREKVVQPGLWFFPETPEIDADGIPVLEPVFNKGLIKLLADRTFDASKQYLWPVPAEEVITNENLTQNPNY